MSYGTHIAQFRLHFYKADSIIRTSRDLNRDEIIYSPEEDKSYKYKYFFRDEEDKNEYLLKEIGNYNEDDGDCEKDYFYFHTPKDVFYVEFLQEISEVQYDDSTNYIEKWFDETMTETDEYYNGLAKAIYEDYKDEIKAFLEKRPNACKCIMDKMVIMQSHNYTTGYEEVEYECDIDYIGPYHLVIPKTLSHEELFEKRNGITLEEHERQMEDHFMKMLAEQEEND